MNKKYQREMEQIHAPRELIDRTKREVREAGGRLRRPEEKRWFSFLSGRPLLLPPLWC